MGKEVYVELRVTIPPRVDGILVLPVELCLNLVDEELEDGVEVDVVGDEIRITLRPDEQFIVWCFQ